MKQGEKRTLTKDSIKGQYSQKDKMSQRHTHTQKGKQFQKGEGYQGKAIEIKIIWNEKDQRLGEYIMMSLLKDSSIE